MGMHKAILAVSLLMGLLSCSTAALHMEYQVKVPPQYQMTPLVVPPSGESEPVRYQVSFEAFWWNCVMVRAENLDARCPFLCSGTGAAAAGCTNGAIDAERQIQGLLKKHSRSEVQRYLRTLASTQEAKEKIHPYFQETPKPEKVE